MMNYSKVGLGYEFESKEKSYASLIVRGQLQNKSYAPFRYSIKKAKKVEKKWVPKGVPS